MIIKSFELEKLKSHKSNLHLIFGNNTGGKEDIIKDVYLKNFNGEVLKYEEKEILDEADKFLSSLFTKSLFENSKLIIISRCSDKLVDLVTEILEKEIIDTKIVINCLNLEKRSKLRIFFEKEKDVICTPVYDDDSRSSNSIINNFLRENKFNLSQEIKNILIERSKGDRINLKNELLKLKNLSISKKN